MTNMTNTIKAMTNHMRKRRGDSPDAKYEVIKSVLLAKVVYKLQSALLIENDEEILKVSLVQPCPNNCEREEDDMIIPPLSDLIPMWLIQRGVAISQR